MFGYEEELQNKIAKLRVENAKLKFRLSVVSTYLDEIINTNTVGSCLCGHGEWCENCNTSSSKNKIKRSLTELRKLLE